MRTVPLRKLSGVDFYIKDLYAINLIPTEPFFIRTSRPTSGFNYILEGEVSYEFDGVVHSFGVGSLVYLPQGSSYVYRTVSTPSRRIQLNFSLLDPADGECINFSSVPCRILNEVSYQMRTTLFDLCDVSLGDGYARGLNARYLMLYLLYQLAYAEHAEFVIQNRSNTVIRCMDSIRQNSSAKIRIEELCERYEISAAHLRRRFKQKAGCTITCYVNRCRIDKALKMLMNTDMSLLDIAVSVGFESENYFCRVFSREVGETPGNYRRTHRLRY